jgi:hypothetical protein
MENLAVQYHAGHEGCREDGEQKADRRGANVGGCISPSPERDR